jgi:hypothetical protein
MSIPFSKYFHIFVTKQASEDWILHKTRPSLAFLFYFYRSLAGYKRITRK